MLSLLFTQPLLFLAWALAFVLALSVHEACHALVSTLLGDETAKRQGRLTLNPLAHLDPMGVVALLAIGFGWGKPVPFNPYNLKWPKWGPVAVAFAGPVSNLLLAIISALLSVLLAPYLGCSNLLIFTLGISAELNIALMAFNLLPFPPLDGSKLLLVALSAPRFARARMMIEVYGSQALFIFVLFSAFFGLSLFSGWIGYALHAFQSIIPIACV